MSDPTAAEAWAGRMTEADFAGMSHEALEAELRTAVGLVTELAGGARAIGDDAVLGALVGILDRLGGDGEAAD